MEKYSVEAIRREILQHKQNCAVQGQLEALFRKDGQTMPAHLKKKLSLFIDKNEMVEGWLNILSEDEAYVVRRHLLDGVTWPRIELEYNERWKDFGKTSRTLMRYYKHALEKIQGFTNAE